jgi:hypothetical protein
VARADSVAQDNTADLWLEPTMMLKPTLLEQHCRLVSQAASALFTITVGLVLTGNDLFFAFIVL